MKIPLTRGYYAIIDEADYDKVKGVKWYAKGKRPRKVYAWSRKYGALHRYLMDAPPGALVDHKNLDSLDCRRCNLRLADHSKNAANASIRLDNATGFKGVSWNKQKRRFEAAIKVNYRKIFLGAAQDAREAGELYERAAREYFGEFARRA